MIVWVVMVGNIKALALVVPAMTLLRCSTAAWPAPARMLRPRRGADAAGGVDIVACDGGGEELLASANKNPLRRRRSGKWAQGASKSRSSSPAVMPIDLDSIIGAVAAEFSSTEEWAQVSDDMMQIYTPSISRPGAGNSWHPRL